MTAAPVRKSPKPPALPKEAELAVVRAFKPYDEDLYTKQWVKKCSAANREADHVVVEECVFEGVDLTGTKLKRFDLADSALRKCDIANAVWDDFEGRRVEFRSCRLLGAKFIEGIFKDATFTDCHGQFTQFRYASLAGAAFAGCDLRDADFSGADLTGATFDNCNLTGAAFLNAKCDGLDIRTSTIENIRIGAVELRGMIVTPLQAVMLAAVFGLRVLNEYDELVEKPEE